MIGSTISHYKILSELGRGGMGVVYKAEDTKLERTVALKFLGSHLLEDEEGRARFIREAKAAASLDHQNICTVHEIDEVEGETFIAMAYIEGQTVKDKIAEHPLKLDEALDIAIQTAQGLQAAHEKDIVHRDIKSANLMVTPQGQVKVMDFGLAHLAEQSRLTKTATILGTPAYMSPEQAQRLPTDRRTDVWSLGVVIYEVVTGCLPFEGERQEAVLYAIANEEPELPTALRSRVPLELDRIVEKALAKDAAERYQHVDEMLVDLRALKKQLQDAGAQRAAPARGTNRGPYTAPSSTAIPAPLDFRRRLWRERIALGAALLIALAILVAMWLRSPEQAIETPLQRFAFMPPEHAVSATISPDGKHIAYVAGNGGLWIQDLDEQEPREIASGAHPFGAPCWSPDSEFIAYREAGDLKKVSVQGGPAATLCQMPNPLLSGCSWDPDGGSIVFSGGGQALYKLPARGGSPTVLIEPDEPAKEFILQPHFLPLDAASRGLLYAVGPLGEQRIVLQDLVTGEKDVLAKGGRAVFSPSGHILFADAGSLFALPFSVASLTAKGEAFPLAKNVRTPSVSADGTLVYLEAGANDKSVRQSAGSEIRTIRQGEG